MKKTLCLALSLALLLSMTACVKLEAALEPSAEDDAFPLEDRYAKCQLSEEQLAAPTEELVEDVLDYPYLGDLFTSSNYSEDTPYPAYDSLREVFNGLVELEKREDASSVMLARLCGLVAAGNFSEGPFLGYAYFLQALLDVPVFHEKLTPSEIAAYEQASNACNDVYYESVETEPPADDAFPFQDSEGYWIMKVENPLSEYQLSRKQLAASTEELLEDVLDSPCLFGLAATHYSFYCEPYEIYKSVRRTFNGLAELEKRGDAPSVMLSKLCWLVAEDRFSEGPFFGYVYYLQALLDVPVFYEKLSPFEAVACGLARDAYIAHRDAEAAADNDTSNLEDYAVVLKAVDHYSEHQLSEEQLAAPTEELVEDVLDFPFLLDITVSNTFREDTPYPAYDSVCNAFNGLAELEKRADASSVMLAKLTELVTVGNFSEDSFLVDAYFLHMLLAVPVYQEMMTPAEAVLFERENAICCDVFYVSLVDDIYASEQLSEEEMAAPTEELVEDVLDYRYLYEFLTNENYSEDAPYAAYDSVSGHFNGFAELEKRADAASVMLAKLTELVTAGKFSEGSSLGDVYFLQALLAVPVFNEKLTPVEAAMYELQCVICRDTFSV